MKNSATPRVPSGGTHCQVVTSSKPWIYLAARSLCKSYKLSVDEAEDYVQDAFIEILQKDERHLMDVLESGRIQGYLFCILRNVISDAAAKQKKRTLDPLRLEATLYDVNYGEETALPLRFDVDSMLDYLAQGLNEQELELVRLRIEKENFQEIASELGTTANNARVRMHRVRPKMRRLFLEAIENF